MIFAGTEEQVRRTSENFASTLDEIHFEKTFAVASLFDMDKTNFGKRNLTLLQSINQIF